MTVSEINVRQIASTVAGSEGLSFIVLLKLWVLV